MAGSTVGSGSVRWPAPAPRKRRLDPRSIAARIDLPWHVPAPASVVPPAPSGHRREPTKGACLPGGAHPAPLKRSRSPAAPTYGERPNAPWHPLPLSELLILVGADRRRARAGSRPATTASGGGRLLLAGLGAVGIGTIEVTLREHRSGYRSHTVMLAGLAGARVRLDPRAGAHRVHDRCRGCFSLGLIALDFALFAVLFKLLRARFLQARHARVIREG